MEITSYSITFLVKSKILLVFIFGKLLYSEIASFIQICFDGSSYFSISYFKPELKGLDFISFSCSKLIEKYILNTFMKNIII